LTLKIGLVFLLASAFFGSWAIRHERVSRANVPPANLSVEKSRKTHLSFTSDRDTDYDINFVFEKAIPSDELEALIQKFNAYTFTLEIRENGTKIEPTHYLGSSIGYTNADIQYTLDRFQAAKNRRYDIWITTQNSFPRLRPTNPQVKVEFAVGPSASNMIAVKGMALTGASALFFLLGFINVYFGWWRSKEFVK
jgi:hypothetical protein